MQNSQEDTFNRVSFLIAASNFINEETLAQCFPKPLTIFTKKFIINVPLGYQYASVLSPGLKPSYSDFLLWKRGTYYSSMVKVSDKNCYHHRFIIQRDQIEKQSNTSYVIESNSSNCNFREALVVLAISLLNGIRFSYRTKHQFFAAFCL